MLLYKSLYYPPLLRKVERVLTSVWLFHFVLLVIVIADSMRRVNPQREVGALKSPAGTALPRGRKLGCMAALFVAIFGGRRNGGWLCMQLLLESSIFLLED